VEGYLESSTSLKEVIFDYSKPLGLRIEAWASWCKLFDDKAAYDEEQADACKVYEL